MENNNVLKTSELNQIINDYKNFTTHEKNFIEKYNLSDFEIDSLHDSLNAMQQD